MTRKTLIEKTLIERFFDAASIQRWNDHVRPVELTELDKQAHKAVIAWVLARHEEDAGQPVDWNRLIEGLIFEFLPRVVLTDIKAPVFHRLQEQAGPQIRAHVVKMLAKDLQNVPGDFQARFAEHLKPPAHPDRERHILGAAHYLATSWEFRLVAHASQFLYGIDRTRQDIENRLEDYVDLIGVQRLQLQRKTYGFIDYCSQLRFQQRWAQTPRVPRTTVLGHSLFVAILAYFFLLEAGRTDGRRRYNNFFSALFHDLPEVLTRDIVAPVKKNIEDLDHHLARLERQMMEEYIKPLLPRRWFVELAVFSYRPFRRRRRAEEEARVQESYSPDHEDLHSDLADDDSDVFDGDLLKFCDHLAAYIEATKSMRYGTVSPQLWDGQQHLYSLYSPESIAGLDARAYFDLFKLSEAQEASIRAALGE